METFFRPRAISSRRDPTDPDPDPKLRYLDIGNTLQKSKPQCHCDIQIYQITIVQPLVFQNLHI